MSEAQRCKAGCGFFGHEATDYYCSLCYKSIHQIKTNPPSAGNTMPASQLPNQDSIKVFTPENPYAQTSLDTINNIRAKKPRCSHESCRKRLKLTDIECRCGMRFCGVHRYAESHNCSFEYKVLAPKTVSNTNAVKRILN